MFIKKDTIINIPLKLSGQRLDKILSIIFNKFSRNYIQNLIKNHKILVNGKLTKKCKLIKYGNEIKIISNILINKYKLNPENIKLNIIYKDDHIIIINKQAGLVVHPATRKLDWNYVKWIIIS